MKRLWSLSTLVLLFALNVAHAKAYFIKLGYVEKTGDARRVAAILERLGYPAYSSEETGVLVLYTGPFDTVSESRKALAAIRKSVTPDAFIVTFAQKRNACNAPATDRKSSQSPKALFAGISIGTSFIEVEKREKPNLSYNPDDRGIGYGILLGYDISDDFFGTLNYRHTRLDDIDLDDFFATINYRFSDFHALSPFVGILGGYSFMEWRNDPFEAIHRDRTSESFVGGGQVGAHAPLYENFRLFTLYRYIFMDHETSVSTHSQAGKIEERSNQIIEMGIRYDF